MAYFTHPIGTLLQRADGPVDVLIRLTAAGYQRASRGFWDEPDPDTLTDLGGPITEAEVVMLREWLATHGDEASDVAVQACMVEERL